VYILNAFGDLTILNALNNSTSQPPYVQLLSVTNDTARALQEFGNARVSQNLSSSSNTSSAGHSSGLTTSTKSTASPQQTAGTGKRSELGTDQILLAFGAVALASLL
jgi:hypothetical protein